MCTGWPDPLGFLRAWPPLPSLSLSLFQYDPSASVVGLTRDHLGDASILQNPGCLKGTSPWTTEVALMWKTAEGCVCVCRGGGGGWDQTICYS